MDCTKKPEVKPEADTMGPKHDYEDRDPDPDERPPKRAKTADFFDLTTNEPVFIDLGFGHQQIYQQKIIKHLQRAMELTKQKELHGQHDRHYKKI